MKEYYANYSLQVNDTEATPPPMDPSDVIRGPCWETAVGIVIKIKQILAIICLYEEIHRLAFVSVDIDNNVLKSVLQKQLFNFVMGNVTHFKIKQYICFAHWTFPKLV